LYGDFKKLVCVLFNVRGVAGYALTADKTVMYGGNSLKNFRD
jgi:hypothetical protein